MDKGIIYIIGAGRSGTTLLDIILGNAVNVFSAGELNRYTKRNGIPHSARDEDVSSFWAEIKIMLKEKGYNDPGTYYKPFSRFEYHSSFFRLPFYNKKKFKQYNNYQHDLFDAVSALADRNFNKKIIVDSSKYPLRAYFLSKIFGINISFIYVQRSPLAVVESFQRKNIEQPSKNRYAAHAYLSVVNNLSLNILKRLKKNHNTSFVSYETLLKDPLKELAKIEADLKIDLSVPINSIKENKPLQVGYIFDGNRLRSEKTIVFRKGSTSLLSPKGIDFIFERLHKLTWYKQLKR